VAITPAERVDWAVDGVIGLKSVAGVGPAAALWQTAWNTPEEWGRSWSGLGKRYAERMVDVSISNTLEGGLGALWHEDPRYIQSGRKGLWPRVRYAMKTSVLAPRPRRTFAAGVGPLRRQHRQQPDRERMAAAQPDDTDDDRGAQRHGYRHPHRRQSVGRVLAGRRPAHP